MTAAPRAPDARDDERRDEHVRAERERERREAERDDRRRGRRARFEARGRADEVPHFRRCDCAEGGDGVVLALSTRGKSARKSADEA